MTVSKFLRDHKLPILSYLVLVISLFVLRLLFNLDLVFTISATLMLVIPLLLKKNTNFLYFNKNGFLKGLLISAIILALYLAVLYFYSLFTGGSLSVREFGLSFLLIQLILVAIPEEIFFRGYLQKEFGNDYKSILIVSVMFAIAHLIVVCAVNGGAGVCIQNGLTFFPSLVMGYLFMKTHTIWSSVVFHFLANVLHILIFIS